MNLASELNEAARAKRQKADEQHQANLRTWATMTERAKSAGPHGGGAPARAAAPRRPVTTAPASTTRPSTPAARQTGRSINAAAVYNDRARNRFATHAPISAAPVASGPPRSFSALAQRTWTPTYESFDNVMSSSGRGGAA